MNTYHVIGLMSGTSLDGVDLAYCVFTRESKNWIYKILNTATFPYSQEWEARLQGLMDVSAATFIQTDHEYGAYLGKLIRQFISDQNFTIDFIASHGHTIFHRPAQHISHQLGHGAYLAAEAGVPVVCDFRTLDIALGGQGAPLVPIGDKLLFGNYDFCLNLGGIANISFEAPQARVAFDTGACNMLLNTLANQLNLTYDQDGNLARSGNLNPALLQELNAAQYFSQAYPKSLGKEWVDANTLTTILAADISVEDKLHTACHHIAWHIAGAIKNLANSGKPNKVLATGGGAFNKYLMELLQQQLGDNFTVVIPEPELVGFKEALIFGFLGVLRWQNEVNCLSSVTGARQDNIGGAIYWGSNTSD